MSPGRFDRALDRFGLWACFAWGVAEATLFFIVPDVAVGAVALHRPSRALAAAGAAVVGALVGGAALALVAGAVGADVLDVVRAVPGIPDRMVVASAADVEARGGVALLLGPAAGVPYKLYATHMALAGWGLPSLLAWTVPARALRIVPVALLCALVGRWARRPLARRRLLGTGIYLLPWYTLYVSYFLANGW